MAEKIRRVRREKRVRRSLPGVESFRIFRHRLKPERIAVLIAGTAFGIVVGIICFSYGSKFYSSWRETRLLKHASEQLQQHDYEGATRSAQQALELHRDSLAAFYVLAEATEQQNRIETVAWRSQIARLLPDSLDSQLNLASAALRFGELDTARKALDRVAPSDRDKAAYHVVAGWLARAQGDEAGLLQHFAVAVKQEPNNDLYQFNFAVLQIKSAEKENSDNARAALERLTKVPQFRAGALRALLSDAVERNDLAMADGLAQDLQMSQQVTFGDYLLCLNLYRKLDEKKFAILLERVKPVAARNRFDLAALMDWMNNNGMSGEVLKWTEKLSSDLTTNPPAAIAVAEAFTDVKNWSRLKRWARGGSWGEADYLRLAYQALAAHQSRQAGADAEFNSLWRSAEKASNDEPQRELNLARLATKWSLITEAEQLWVRVAKNTPMRREALDALARIYRTNNDLPNLYRTMQRVHETSPGDPSAAANYARLALLLDQNAAEGHRVAKEAYDHAQSDVNCAVTYAFSLYGLGRTAEGLEILEKIPAEQLHDPHAAVYAAVLLLDENQSETAKEYIETAQRGPIFVEEKKLLDEAVSKIAATAGASATPPAPGTHASASPSPTAKPSPSVAPSPKATPSPPPAPPPASPPPASFPPLTEPP
jgi:Tfp pilus assembly protein PilF